jgi:hypothetical protein
MKLPTSKSPHILRGVRALPSRRQVWPPGATHDIGTESPCCGWRRTIELDRAEAPPCRPQHFGSPPWTNCTGRLAGSGSINPYCGTMLRWRSRRSSSAGAWIRRAIYCAATPAVACAVTAVRRSSIPAGQTARSWEPFPVDRHDDLLSWDAP